MQTLRVIRTIQWIESFFGDETKSVLFNPQVLTGDTQGSDFLPRLIAATHELAVASSTLGQNPDAIRVIKAFDLEPLLDNSFATNLALAASKGSDGESFSSLMQMIVEPWNSMTACVRPLESLATPAEMREKGSKDSILTIEFDSKEPRPPTITELARVLALLQQAYSAVAVAEGSKGDRHLAVVYVDTDFPFRIDCKGYSKTVGPLRNFIIEAWYKLRHKNVADLLDNNLELLKSFPVMDHLAIAEGNQVITTDEAAALRKKILGGTLGIFVHGATLADIPTGHSNSAIQSGRQPEPA